MTIEPTRTALVGFLGIVTEVWIPADVWTGVGWDESSSPAYVRFRWDSKTRPTVLIYPDSSPRNAVFQAPPRDWRWRIQLEKL
jgi:hypothetical protein